MTTDSEEMRNAIRAKNEQYERIPLLELIHSDAAKCGGFAKALRNVGFHVALVYRVGHFLYRHKLGCLILPAQAVVGALTLCHINKRATIGPGLVLPHPMSIFVAPNVCIGRDCRLGPRVFVASDFHPENLANYPVLSDGVSIGVGAVVLGGIAIGEGVVVGPNTVVSKDIPGFCNVPSQPVRGVPRVRDPWD